MKCHSTLGLLLLVIAALLGALATFSLLDDNVEQKTDVFFGVWMLALAAGVPGLFLCTRAAVKARAATAWFYRWLKPLACCSFLSALVNTVAVFLLLTSGLMTLDGLLGDEQGFSAALGTLMMAGIVFLVGWLLCRISPKELKQTDVKPLPKSLTFLGNFSAHRIACPSCNAPIPLTQQAETEQSHLSCPYCGTDVVLKDHS